MGGGVLVNDGPPTTEYMTVEEFAAEFRISESAVYRALREQRLPAVKILGRWRISRAESLAQAVREGSVKNPASRGPMPATRRRTRSDGFRAKVIELRRNERQ